MGALPAALTIEPTGEWSLIRRATEGDPGSFEDLYREHAGRVFALCARMCGDRGRAEDLTQEVFVRAWRQLDSFRGESRFSSWLHRLAVNVVLGDERHRVRRIDPARAAVDPSWLDRAASGAGPGRRADLEAAIAALPPGAREVLVLHDIEGYKHEEIAEMTGRSPGTCRAQLHRARRLMREALR
jgi:RNA polymerase sigma-70 factor, ECF subfamily